MQPSLSDPVETMEDIVKSGLPWRMPLYGETVEKFWAEHSDPTVKVLQELYNPFLVQFALHSTFPWLQEFWHGKEIVGYSDFPHKYVGIEVQF